MLISNNNSNDFLSMPSKTLIYSIKMARSLGGACCWEKYLPVVRSKEKKNRKPGEGGTSCTHLLLD